MPVGQRPQIDQLQGGACDHHILPAKRERLAKQQHRGIFAADEETNEPAAHL